MLKLPLQLLPLVLVLGLSARAQFIPMDLGTTVNGYQDDFDGSTIAAGWLVSGQDGYSVADGLLQITTVFGDPNHLLYAGGSYDAERQEVLARIRIRDFGTGDASRAGLGTAVDPGS